MHFFPPCNNLIQSKPYDLCRSSLLISAQNFQTPDMKQQASEFGAIELKDGFLIFTYIAFLPPMPLFSNIKMPQLNLLSAAMKA
jgi:hypothetical protein